MKVKQDQDLGIQISLYKNKFFTPFELKKNHRM